jgi:hypothetical protein
MTHAWCRDIPRDEAVRADEDGRSGLLPTLEEAISRAGQSGPPEPSQQQNCTEREIGLRTERVTLEITIDADQIPTEWPWDSILRRLVHADKGESVRVVEETHFDDLAQVAMERDAAIRERESLREQLESVADRAAAAEMALEFAPQTAPGWLTAEEREAVAFAARMLCELCNRQYVNGDQDAARDTAREYCFVQSLLARSSPPEVVLRSEAHSIIYADNKNMNRVFRAKDVIEALAAIGVSVKEVGRE